MVENYADLRDTIINDSDGAAQNACSDFDAGVLVALEWLDEHRDQAPGRTITESEFLEVSDAHRNGGLGWKDLADSLNITVVPDPEPTDVEKITRLILENSTDMDPKFIAEMLVENGVRPLKAGGDEPDAEHDRAWWVENANINDAEDCEACVDDLCPVHHGIALGIEFVAKKIAALGDDPELFNSIPNPLKAPGGDDE